MPLAVEEPPTAAPVPLPVRSVIVSLEEAAAFLEITPTHALELTKIGLLPCLKSGDECYVRFGDVVEYQRERESRRQRERASPLDKIRDLIYAEGLDRLPIRYETH